MTLVEANKAQRRELFRTATGEDLLKIAAYWSARLKQAESEQRVAQTELAEVLLAIQERRL